MKKTGVSASGIFTIKEYLMDEGTDIPGLLTRLQSGPGEIQEIISYVFEGEDPLHIDAVPFSVEDFLKLYPQMKSYGPGLCFDVLVKKEGHPVTVELTEGDPTVCTNSLDKEVELDDLLGPETVTEADGGHPDQMTPRKLLEILSVAERLKCNTRHCDTSSGRRESVAEHSWRAALMAMLLSKEEEFADLDMDRVIRMCLIHDLGEAFTGDIPAFEKSTEDDEREDALFSTWIDGFPKKQAEEFRSLFAEMRDMQTREAKLYKAIDKMEAVIQHNESDISSWLPLEYDLQLTHGSEEVGFSPWMRSLKEAVDCWTKEKIGNHNEK